MIRPVEMLTVKNRKYYLPIWGWGEREKQRQGKKRDRGGCKRGREKRREREETDKTLRETWQSD